MQQQKGFLLVVALTIVVIFALLSAALVSIYIRSTEVARQLQAIPAAAALAESGLENAKNMLAITTLSTRPSCASLSSTRSLSTGNSTITSAGAPSTLFTTLAVAIANNTTPSTLTVTSTSGFPTAGWIMIGREVFQYGYIADSTTFGNVTRALEGSLPTEHQVGAIVSQNQCAIISTGTSPAANVTAKRQYQQSLRQPVVFAVGSNGSIFSWNTPTELTWSMQTLSNTSDLNSISALNYGSAWAVSSVVGANTYFARLQGTTWTGFAVKFPINTGLWGVYATSEAEVWALGARHGNDTNIIRWIRNTTNDNTNWCQLPCGGITLSEASVQNQDKDLYALKAYDINGDNLADVGFAVGGNAGTGVIMYYSGTGWSPINKTPLSYNIPANTGNLRGLDMTPNGSNAPKEVFFVGQTSNGSPPGLLIRLRITGGVPAWTTITFAQKLRAVSVIDTNGDGLAELGCAVGDNGFIAIFNESLATSTTTLTGASTTPIESVVILNTNDIWVTGDNGLRFHYDGTSWTSATNNVTTSNNIYSVVAIYPKSTSLSGWKEIIN